MFVYPQVILKFPFLPDLHEFSVEPASQSAYRILLTAAGLLSFLLEALEMPGKNSAIVTKTTLHTDIGNLLIVQTRKRECFSVVFLKWNSYLKKSI